MRNFPDDIMRYFAVLGMVALAVASSPLEFSLNPGLAFANSPAVTQEMSIPESKLLFTLTNAFIPETRGTFRRYSGKLEIDTKSGSLKKIDLSVDGGSMNFIGATAFQQQALTALLGMDNSKVTFTSTSISPKDNAYQIKGVASSRYGSQPFAILAKLSKISPTKSQLSGTIDDNLERTMPEMQLPPGLEGTLDFNLVFVSPT